MGTSPFQGGTSDAGKLHGGDLFSMMILVSHRCLLDGYLTDPAVCRELGVCSFPKLRPAGGLTFDSDFWAVKFYPYTQPGVDPVFAVAGGKRVGHLCPMPTAYYGESDLMQILVCRPPGKENSKTEVIQLIIDEDVSRHPSPASLSS